MLKENLCNIFDKIKNGNNLGEKIYLVGASKTMSPDIINQAHSFGLNIVAENKVQEFREKNPLLSPTLSQHFIGHLQTNKVKYLIGKVDLIHSVDTLKLAEEISKESVKKDVITNILVEVNISKEESKSGFFEQDLLSQIALIKKLPNISVLGLMAMLPHSDNKDYLAHLCDKMRKIYDNFNENGYNFVYLSMGMSADYEIAIKHGSNMIRLGSSIFGQRIYN